MGKLRSNFFTILVLVLFRVRVWTARPTSKQRGFSLQIVILVFDISEIFGYFCPRYKLLVLFGIYEVSIVIPSYIL